MYESERYSAMLEGEMKIEFEKPEIEVVALSDGLGFGEGSISSRRTKEEAGEEVMQRVEAAIESDEILMPVSRNKDGSIIDDDGCGDGRNVKRIFHGAIERAKSLVRPKVFGGGATMRAAMGIGVGEASGKPLNGLFSYAIGKLKDRQIDFGAHTDIHAHGDNCGCGAIDKAPEVVANVVKFEHQITDTIIALGVDTDGLDDVLDNYRAYAAEVNNQPYSGKQVATEIIESGKVVKELDDDHKEALILLNTVEGYTVNQELVRQVSGNKVQVFAVDVWRLQALAMRSYPNDPEKQNRAFLSELVYTLGVAGTLTPGDQPVRQIQKKDLVLAA